MGIDIIDLFRVYLCEIQRAANCPNTGIPGWQGSSHVKGVVAVLFYGRVHDFRKNASAMRQATDSGQPFPRMKYFPSLSWAIAHCRLHRLRRWQGPPSKILSLPGIKKGHDWS